MGLSTTFVTPFMLIFYLFHRIRTKVICINLICWKQDQNQLFITVINYLSRHTICFQSNSKQMSLSFSLTLLKFRKQLIQWNKSNIERSFIGIEFLMLSLSWCRYFAIIVTVLLFILFYIFYNVTYLLFRSFYLRACTWVILRQLVHKIIFLRALLFFMMDFLLLLS